MNPLLQAAKEILDWTDGENLKSCLIGGVALLRWGEPRLTQDVDLTLLAGFGGEDAIVKRLLQSFEPRRSNAVEFALRYRVVLLRASNLVPIDVALGAIDYEVECIERSSLYKFANGYRLRTCSAEDLIIHKVVAGRPRDISDLETIVSRQIGKLNLELIRRWLTAFAEVKGDPNLVAPFENALKKSRADLRRKGKRR